MRNQHGNVLFIILIAVALFAALSYAVTRSTSGTSSTGTEKAKLTASSILQLTTAIKVGVDRLRISGVALADVSFENSVESGYAHTPVQPNSHKIFHPEGAGASYPNIPIAGTIWLITGSNYVQGIGTDSGTCWSSPYTCNELVIMLRFVPLDICKAINDIVGMNNPSGNPPVDAADYDGFKYTGTFGSGHSFSNLAQDFMGKEVGCFESQAKGGYHYYHVLATQT